MMRKLIGGVAAAAVALSLVAGVFGTPAAEASPATGSCVYYRYNVNFLGYGDCAYTNAYTYPVYSTLPYYYNYAYTYNPYLTTAYNYSTVPVATSSVLPSYYYSTTPVSTVAVSNYTGWYGYRYVAPVSTYSSYPGYTYYVYR